MRNSEEMLCREDHRDERVYDFHCPACDDEGELTLDANEEGQLGCPAGCGASFIEYKSDKGWVLRCVVRPFFATTPEDH